MHAMIKTCVLFLSVTLVRGQVCTKESFLTGPLFNSSFDTVSLAESYEAKRQVRVGCKVGYTGFFKLVCKEDGTWDSKGNGCEPKSCGHPGDASFADFHLESGSDFVFSSKVVYTCQRGYQMVSRRNYRRCMAEGWDGFIPVCEAQRCPVILVNNNLKVVGDPEDAAFGNVVQFSCKSSTEVLKGPPEVLCDENGEWRGAGWEGQPPRCEEIICRLPTIANGDVSGADRDYKQNEQLDFKCHFGFVPLSGIASRCTKVGQNADWSPKPACEPVKCELELPPMRGTTYKPASGSLFTPGNNVTVTCGESYWIQNHQTTSAVTTCKPDGQWTIRPICQEVICSNRKEPNVHYWELSYWHQKRPGDQVRYWCKENYKSTATVATCTRDGWTPKPLCQVTSCQQLQIKNAQITYNPKWTYADGEVVQYTCRNSGREERLSLTCDEGVWKGKQSCTEVDRPCPLPEFPHGFVSRPQTNTLYYSCDEGYKFPTKAWWGVAQCEDGVWSGLQHCIEETKCGEPPVVPNGSATPERSVATGAQFLRIQCDVGYFASTERLMCEGGRWHSDGEQLRPLCQAEAVHCSPPPRVDNTVVWTPYKEEFLSQSEVTYRCRENFTMEGGDTIRCINGEWEEKNTSCTQKPCPLPEETPHGSYEIIFGEELVYGTMIQYTCSDGYRLVDQNAIRTCLLDGWSNSVPTCERATCKLTNLHPSLSVTGLSSPGETMDPGHKLQFSCNEDDMDGPPEIECLASGTWSSPFPTCSEKCIITNVPNNVRHNQVPGNKLKRGQNLTFTCRLRDHVIQGEETIECLANGRWSHSFPTCAVPATCGRPPPLTDGDTKETPKFNYEHNDEVEYVCQSLYLLDGGSHKICVNGEWTGEIRCIQACTVDEDSLRRHHIEFRYSHKKKLYSAHNDELEFRCKRGYHSVGVEMRQTCLNGVVQLPTCQ